MVKMNDEGSEREEEELGYNYSESMWGFHQLFSIFGFQIPKEEEKQIEDVPPDSEKYIAVELGDTGLAVYIPVGSVNLGSLDEVAKTASEQFASMVYGTSCNDPLDETQKIRRSTDDELRETGAYKHALLIASIDKAPSEITRIFYSKLLCEGHFSGKEALKAEIENLADILKKSHIPDNERYELLANQIRAYKLAQKDMGLE